jgi:phosphoribosylformylglycinamidine synthase PurS subunit
LRARIFVTPRHGILDPQGRAVEHALKTLGFDQVGNVQIGRYIVLDLEAANTDEARAAVTRMCEQLLVNPLIEDYRFEVDE